MHQLLKAISLSAALVAFSAQASPLSELPPYAVAAFGQESDSGVVPHVQTIEPVGNASVTAVSWWGYHGVNSIGAANDDFLVQLNGATVLGLLTADASSSPVPYYTYALVQPLVGAPTTLSISNQGVDVEWFWQSAAAVGGAHATDVAYRLEGSVNAVPEPSSISILLLSMSLFWAIRFGGPRFRGMASAIRLAK